MTATRSGFNAILTPAQVQSLLVLPALNAAVFSSVTTLLNISSSSTRIPRVTADPSAAWTLEGAEINPSDATVDEIDVMPAKLAGLSIITQELADDSSPAALQVVGDGLARDIARRVDQAAFQGMASPAPAGLATLAGVTTISAGSTWVNLDPFLAAVSAIETVGATVTAFVANPADVLALETLKMGTGSNVPLLAPDTASPTGRSLVGRTLHVSPYVTAGTVWGLDSSRSYLVVREGATVESDSSVFFTSHRVALRAIFRVGFGFADPRSIVKITLSS